MILYFVATKATECETNITWYPSRVKQVAAMRAFIAEGSKDVDIWTFSEDFSLNSKGITKALEFGVKAASLQFGQGGIEASDEPDED